MAVTEAAIKLVVMLRGASTATVSCVILHMADMGVTSVSPVARQATRAKRKLRPTVVKPTRGLIEKATYCKITEARARGTTPMISQLLGTSMAASGSLSPSCLPLLRPVKLRTMVFHSMAKAVSPEVTIMAEPVQSAQPLIRSLGLLMMPACKSSGETIK
ncbi:MAG: hypothetical protein BWY75_03710 [bacterium ADurb.Bin425]|nr:MAG: hypothetical protein BWY75_03710 [bacterium ADurb.Bin425]